jgi:hypothetical protein
MHIFRFIHRGKPPVTRAEPRATPAVVAVDEAFPEPDARRAGEDLRGSAAIYGLIGSQRALEETGLQHSTQPDAADLIATLHTQYCQALENPWASIGGADWVSPASFTDRHGRGKSDLRESTDDSDSIEALLSGAQLLDHAFGQLRDSDLGGLPESEPAPEILRLFAPPEYLASAWRSIATLPPTLARREHHSPGIDSPLRMPDVTSDVTLKAGTS